MRLIRNASTLLLAASKTAEQSVYVLGLKRSSEISHMPNAYVFPGGNCHVADEHPDWLLILSPMELNVNLNIVGVRDTSSRAQVSKAVSLRITAIRETFEECGILLCKHKNDSLSFKVSDFDIEDKNDWRKKIYDNPYEFLNLCRMYECSPNISGLHLLSNWISPTTLLKRYDSKFFIAIMERLVQGEPDNIEINKVEWQTASYFIKNNNIFLPPPQIYELMRLEKIKNIDILCKFVVGMDSSNCKPFISVQVFTTDGMIVILPGDEKYNELFDEKKTDTTHFNCDIAQFRGNVMHRLEYRDVPNSVPEIGLVVKNYDPGHNDFFNSEFSSINSKL